MVAVVGLMLVLHLAFLTMMCLVPLHVGSLLGEHKEIHPIAHVLVMTVDHFPAFGGECFPYLHLLYLHVSLRRSLTMATPAPSKMYLAEN